MNASTGSKEKAIIAVGFLTWGMAVYMRNSFGYYLDELSISATQVGIANAVVSACACVSAIIVGALAEKKGKIFSALGLMILAITAGVLLLATAKNFPMILVSRVFLGIGCGPVFPLVMKSVEMESSKKTYPRNVGLVSNGEPWISTIFGPVIVVAMLKSLGFFGTNGVFALLLLVLGIIWFGMGRKENHPVPMAKKQGTIGTLLKNRHVQLCIAGGALNLVAAWCIFMYVPTLLQKEGHLSDTWMSFTMTAMGVCMAIGMVAFPSWYAKYSDKRIVELGCILAAVGLGAIMIFPGNIMAIVLYILFGGLASVMSLFFMAIMSVERIPENQSALALSLINGGCELLGASIGPMIAGWLADCLNLRVSMLISMVCMVLSAGVVMLIAAREKRDNA